MHSLKNYIIHISRISGCVDILNYLSLSRHGGKNLKQQPDLLVITSMLKVSGEVWLPVIQRLSRRYAIFGTTVPSKPLTGFFFFLLILTANWQIDTGQGFLTKIMWRIKAALILTFSLRRKKVQRRRVFTPLLQVDWPQSLGQRANLTQQSP